jgi:protein-disulfide isomerase
MSSRVEAKQRLRDERIAREREREDRARRGRRLWTLAAVAGLAAIAVAVLIAISQSGGGGDHMTPSVGAGPRFAGIPQSGATLGRPGAPVTMVEYVDLQCPFCREYTTGVLPTLVDRYVRTGKLRIELRPVAILGGDSERAAAAAGAAANENRLWQFTDAFYLQQGQENTGYVTDGFLRRIAAASGVSGARVVAAADSGAAPGTQGVESTPSFRLGPTGGTLKPLEVASLEPGSFTGPIDEALAR